LLSDENHDDEEDKDVAEIIRKRIKQVFKVPEEENVLSY